MNLNFFKGLCKRPFTTNEILNLIFAALKVEEAKIDYSDEQKRIEKMKEHSTDMSLYDFEYLNFSDTVHNIAHYEIANTLSECFGAQTSEKEDICNFLGAQISNDNSTIVFSAEKFAGDLFAFFNEYVIPSEYNLILICQSEIGAKILKLLLKLEPIDNLNCTIKYESKIALTNIEDYKIGAIIADIPAHRYLNESGKTIRLYYDKALLNFLNLPNARKYEMLFVLPRQFFTDDSVKDLRAFINSNYNINKISFSNHNKANESTKSALISLSNKDGRNTIIVSEKGEKTTVTTNELATIYTDWGENTFFRKNTANQLPLNQFAKVFRGMKMSNTDLKGKSEIDSQNTCYVVGISEIEDNFINFENDNYCAIEKRRIRPEIFLKNGDILLTSRGTQLKSVIFNNTCDTMCIPASTLLIIRPDHQQLNPYYLQAILKNEKTQNELLSLSRLVNKINLSIEDIEKIELPVPSIDQQELYAEKYISALKSLYDAQKKVDKCIKQIKKLEKEALL